jgi:hypothetical protein
MIDATTEDVHGWHCGNVVPPVFGSVDLWLGGSNVRRARMSDGRSIYMPGVLLFADCTHPLQNAVVDLDRVRGWRPTAAPRTA